MGLYVQRTPWQDSEADVDINECSRTICEYPEGTVDSEMGDRPGGPGMLCKGGAFSRTAIAELGASQGAPCSQ